MPAVEHDDFQKGTVSFAAKSKRKRGLLVPQILIVVGIVLCLSPLISDQVARWQAEQSVSSMTDYAASLSTAQRQDIIAQARAYNARMGNYSTGWISAFDSETVAESVKIKIDRDEILPYEKQLHVEGSDSIGWIEIPRAAISLPLYHGDDETALSQGVGHVDASSLPVGGKRAHAWLEGHSGVRTSSLFDNIRSLDKGDVFALHAVGEIFAYRVTSWEIVDPDEITSVSPEDGDKVTLVTCTTEPDEWNPRGRVGVNDKRLLIHAERCEYKADEFSRSAEEAAFDPNLLVNEHSLQALLAFILLLLVVLAVVIRRVYTKSKVKQVFEGERNEHS